MIIDCISDLHGHYPKLEGGDLLIVAGDLTARDTTGEYYRFKEWLNIQKYEKCILVAGNHDNCIEQDKIHHPSKWIEADYLCDSGTELGYEEPVRNIFDPDDKSFVNKKKLKIWGSPWTLTFPGINPHCKAFTGTEEELEVKFALIPDDVDILVTHGPPSLILDENCEGIHCGSYALFSALSRIQPKLHVFGHIHEAYGRIEKVWVKSDPKHKIKNAHISVNCSHVNEHYKPVNKPVRIIL